MKLCLDTTKESDLVSQLKIERPTKNETKITDKVNTKNEQYGTKLYMKNIYKQ